MASQGSGGSATTSAEEVRMDLGHDVARLKGSNLPITKAFLSAEHLERVKKRFELKDNRRAGAGAGAGAGEELVYEVCLKELSEEELSLSKSAGEAEAAAVLRAKTKSGILMKRKTEELLRLYSRPENVLFITDINVGYVVGTELHNPYRHPEAGNRGGAITGTFNISSLEPKDFSIKLNKLIDNLLTDTTPSITQRMYCRYIILTKIQWRRIISQEGIIPITQTLIEKLLELDISKRIDTIPDTQHILLQIYETIIPDDSRGSLEYANFTACLSTGRLVGTEFTRNREDQNWICCTLFTSTVEGQCLVSFGGKNPRMANSRVIPFVDTVLQGNLRQAGQADKVRHIDFIEDVDLESFVLICRDLPESRLKLATAGASHKSGTDSNCRRFAREVAADPLYENRTIHITTGDGWFFKILSEQLNGMLTTIVGQHKKVILEYTPDKICNLYGYTRDDNNIQRICLGEMELQRKNRILAAVAKGKATRARNKIDEAQRAAQGAHAAGGAHAALILERAERIRRRNNAIFVAAEAAEAAAEAAAQIAAPAAEAAEPAAEQAAEPTEAEAEEAVAEAVAEAAAEDDEDADEDIYELLSLVSNDVVSSSASLLGSPVGSFSHHGSLFSANSSSFPASPLHSAPSSAPRAPPAPQLQPIFWRSYSGRRPPAIPKGYFRTFATINGIHTATNWPNTRQRTRKHKPRKTRKHKPRKTRKTRKV